MGCNFQPLLFKQSDDVLVSFEFRIAKFGIFMNLDDDESVINTSRGRSFMELV